jgi:hypothetical protein
MTLLLLENRWSDCEDKNKRKSKIDTDLSMIIYIQMVDMRHKHEASRSD